MMMCTKKNNWVRYGGFFCLFSLLLFCVNYAYAKNKYVVFSGLNSTYHNSNNAVNYSADIGVYSWNTNVHNTLMGLYGSAKMIGQNNLNVRYSGAAVYGQAFGKGQNGYTQLLKVYGFYTAAYAKKPVVRTYSRFGLGVDYWWGGIHGVMNGYMTLKKEFQKVYYGEAKFTEDLQVLAPLTTYRNGDTLGMISLGYLWRNVEINTGAFVGKKSVFNANMGYRLRLSSNMGIVQFKVGYEYNPISSETGVFFSTGLTFSEDIPYSGSRVHLYDSLQLPEIFEYAISSPNTEINKDLLPNIYAISNRDEYLNHITYDGEGVFVVKNNIISAPNITLKEHQTLCSMYHCKFQLSTGQWVTINMPNKPIPNIIFLEQGITLQGDQSNIMSLSLQGHNKTLLKVDTQATTEDHYIEDIQLVNGFFAINQSNSTDIVNIYLDNLSLFFNEALTPIPRIRWKYNGNIVPVGGLINLISLHGTMNILLNSPIDISHDVDGYLTAGGYVFFRGNINFSQNNGATQSIQLISKINVEKSAGVLCIYCFVNFTMNASSPTTVLLLNNVSYTGDTHTSLLYTDGFFEVSGSIKNMLASDSTVNIVIDNVSIQGSFQTPLIRIPGNGKAILGGNIVFSGSEMIFPEDLGALIDMYGKEDTEINANIIFPDITVNRDVLYDLLIMAGNSNLGPYASIQVGNIHIVGHVWGNKLGDTSLSGSIIDFQTGGNILGDITLGNILIEGLTVKTYVPPGKPALRGSVLNLHGTGDHQILGNITVGDIRVNRQVGKDVINLESAQMWGILQVGNIILPAGALGGILKAQDAHVNGFIHIGNITVGELGNITDDTLLSEAILNFSNATISEKSVVTVGDTAVYGKINYPRILDFYTGTLNGTVQIGDTALYNDVSATAFISFEGGGNIGPFATLQFGKFYAKKIGSLIKIGTANTPNTSYSGKIIQTLSHGNCTVNPATDCDIRVENLQYLFYTNWGYIQGLTVQLGNIYLKNLSTNFLVISSAMTNNNMMPLFSMGDVVVKNTTGQPVATQWFYVNKTNITLLINSLTLTGISNKVFYFANSTVDMTILGDLNFTNTVSSVYNFLEISATPGSFTVKGDINIQLAGNANALFYWHNSSDVVLTVGGDINVNKDSIPTPYNFYYKWLLVTSALNNFTLNLHNVSMGYETRFIDMATTSGSATVKGDINLQSHSANGFMYFHGGNGFVFTAEGDINIHLARNAGHFLYLNTGSDLVFNVGGDINVNKDTGYDFSFSRFLYQSTTFENLTLNLHNVSMGYGVRFMVINSAMGTYNINIGNVDTISYNPGTIHVTDDLFYVTNKASSDLNFTLTMGDIHTTKAYRVFDINPQPKANFTMDANIHSVTVDGNISEDFFFVEANSTDGNTDITFNVDGDITVGGTIGRFIRVLPHTKTTANIQFTADSVTLNGNVTAEFIRVDPMVSDEDYTINITIPTIQLKASLANYFIGENTFYGTFSFTSTNRITLTNDYAARIVSMGKYASGDIIFNLDINELKLDKDYTAGYMFLFYGATTITSNLTANIHIGHLIVGGNLAVPILRMGVNNTTLPLVGSNNITTTIDSITLNTITNDVALISTSYAIGTFAFTLSNIDIPTGNRWKLLNLVANNDTSQLNATVNVGSIINVLQYAGPLTSFININQNGNPNVYTTINIPSITIDGPLNYLMSVTNIPKDSMPHIHFTAKGETIITTLNTSLLQLHVADTNGGIDYSDVQFTFGKSDLTGAALWIKNKTAAEIGSNTGNIVITLPTMTGVVTSAIQMNILTTVAENSAILGGTGAGIGVDFNTLKTTLTPNHVALLFNGH